MTRINRKSCPRCGFYNIKITPELNDILIDEFAKHKKAGKKLTNDKMFNKILGEYFFARDNKAVMK